MGNRQKFMIAATQEEELANYNRNGKDAFVMGLFESIKTMCVVSFIVQPSDFVTSSIIGVFCYAAGASLQTMQMQMIKEDSNYDAATARQLKDLNNDYQPEPVDKIDLIKQSLIPFGYWRYMNPTKRPRPEPKP